MRKLILSLIVTFISCSVFAEDNWGIGLAIGAPTAVVGEYWYDTKTSYDVGLSFFDSTFVLVYGDKLWHFPGAWKSARDPIMSALIPYIGVGPVLALTSTNRGGVNGIVGNNSGTLGLGVRVPFGVEWRGKEPDIGVFGEIAPGIAITPSTGLILEIEIGAKYYF